MCVCVGVSFCLCVRACAAYLMQFGYHSLGDEQNLRNNENLIAIGERVLRHDADIVHSGCGCEKSEQIKKEKWKNSFSTYVAH